MTILYQSSRWAAVLGASLCLCSEKITYIALMVSAVLWLLADWKYHQLSPTRAWEMFGKALKTRQWWAWFMLACFIWVAEGLFAGLIQNHVPPTSHLYKSFLVLAAVVGYRVLPSFNRLFWKRLILGVLLGGVFASGAGFMQYNKGGFPMETLLMSSAEKTEKRHYRGQLYIPGTRDKAATGPLRNRIKTSVTLLWVFALLIGLTQIVDTQIARCSLFVLGVLFAAFSMLTFAKAGAGAALLCLLGSLVLQEVAAFRRVLGLTLCIIFIIGMSFVGLTATNYAPNVKAPIAEDKVSIRGFAWSHGVKVVREYPVLGVGLGAYARVSPSVFIDPELARSYTVHSHCQHLTALAEGGPLGFSAWILLIGLIGGALQKSWLVKSHPADAEFKALRLAVTYILLSVFLVSFVHDVLFHPSVAALFWVIVGLGGYLSLETNAQEPEGAQ